MTRHRETPFGAPPRLGRRVVMDDRAATNGRDVRVAAAAAALAARSSADTETLRGALAQLERLAGDECGPLRMVVLDAVETVRAALDGEQRG